VAHALQFWETDPCIGLQARKRRDGPELQIVRDFVDLVIATAQADHEHVAIFREPKLATGFPDIVVTYFDPCRFREWAPDRSSLTVRELKVLQHLHYAGGATINTIAAQLGLDQQTVETALTQLHDSRLVRRSGTQWLRVSLRYSFGLTRIVAIEAKIARWDTVFQQASCNRWFASETYVLMPPSKLPGRAKTRSSQLGIGILTCSGTHVQEYAPPTVMLCFMAIQRMGWSQSERSATGSRLRCIYPIWQRSPVNSPS
jgi:hypothetical protein